MSEGLLEDSQSKAVGALAATRSGNSSNKNEIKISADGVAKLTFNFLDDHHADSSLEPGEVKTPPHGSSGSPRSSPLSSPINKVASSYLSKVSPVPALHNAGESIILKRAKTTSQSDAQACQEKVRAILELDAIKRREEAEKKKQQQAGSQGIENKETKRKAKAEKKRLKKLKKEKKLNIELYSEDEVEGAKINLLENIMMKKNDKESYSSEEEGENHDDDDDDIVTPSQISTAPRYAVVSTGPLPPHLTTFPDQYLGFRPMNPFLRLPRPDFHHQRGGFHMRGRGGMRGALRFPSFRPPFHGGAPPRHINAMQRQQTPPPARGHSPILAPPSDNLIWTTTKPSISYAFNTRDTCKVKLLSKSVAKEPSPNTKTEPTQCSSLLGSENKIHKKSKKPREHEKQRKSSGNSIEKLSKRKVDRVKKTLDSPTESKRTRTPEIQYIKDESYLKLKNISKDIEKPSSKEKPKANVATDDSEEMWDEDEQPITSTTTPPQQSSYGFELEKEPLVMKKFLGSKESKTSRGETFNENITEGPALPPNIACSPYDTSTESSNSSRTNNFDMFADSPPRTRKPSTKPNDQDIDELLLKARKAAHIKTEEKPVKQAVKMDCKSEDSSNETGGTTPPKSLLKNFSKSEVEKSSVQKAMEIQSQINTQLRDSVLNSSKSKNMPQIENNSALHKAIEAKNRINKLLNEDISVTSNLKTKTGVDMPKISFQNVQNRIDELLKEDDVDSSRISKIRARHLAHEHQKERETHNESKPQKQKQEKAFENKQRKTRRSLTPELRNVRPKNPFKRSISRERQREHRSRTRTPKRDLPSKRSTFEKRNKPRRSNSRLRGGSITSLNRSSSSSFNRSSGNDRQHTKSLRTGVGNQLRKSSPRASRNSSKEKIKGGNIQGKGVPSLEKSDCTLQKKKNKAPLSFTAAEFLFPEDDELNEDDSSKSSSQKLVFAEDDTTSSGQQRKSSKKSKAHKDDSPDTDDYMDNWENDDVDLDINSNNACDSSTPMRSSSQEDVDEEKFVARFVNPSPPSFVQSLKETPTKDQQLNFTLSESPVAKNTKSIVDIQQQSSTEPKREQKKELFGMQEIYDQFIKSVEESGVDLISTESSIHKENFPGDPPGNKNEDLSTSSTSTSSTSSSSCSSSSEGSSTSSYSSSSSSASSSEESNDADSFKNITLDSPKPKPKDTKPKPVVVVKIEEKALTPPLPLETSNTPEKEPMIADTYKTPTTQKPVSPTQKDPEQPKTAAEIKTETPTTSTAAVKSQKSDVAKDFKKLKSLEANLSRIQMMRANYDSADEISDELLKMENLFLHEKNLILQKYAKSSKTTTNESNDKNASVAASTTGHFVASLQQTMSETENAAASGESNKIFDSNREAIKLTISPLKLPRTSALFSKAPTVENAELVPTDPDETDFTEKLQKPAKEVAIVKPMMESKDLRSSQTRQHRRTTPTRTRSPSSGYHRDRRRSTSRSRFSPQQRRQPRGRSLSVSPPPRRGGASSRFLSPTRRGASNTFSTNISRGYRNSGRRSRSRSRSATRQVNRRVSERSRRAGANVPGGHSQTHYRKTTTQQLRPSIHDSRSRSRSRSPPRSPPSPRSPPRPHSPRSSHSSPFTRRLSYSRERYSSRSPLPFKPPSPPMRRSLSPNLQRRMSISPAKRSRDSSATRHSRSHSRSRSPSIRYDDHRRHRSSSYDRRSSPLQGQYFVQNSSNGTASSASSSSYYYNLSPNRISLDARINIVLNGPPNQESSNNSNFDSYSNYGQYGGQYMSIPPQPEATSYGINYATNQYVPLSSSDLSNQTQQVYSNIPTIGGGGVPTPAAAQSNYYYNEFSAHTNAHQPSSVLKELPKATVAVQKGNVLEIVPSAELTEGNESIQHTLNTTNTSPAKQAKVKKRKKTLSWKEEINSRHVTAAVLRLSRENDGLSKGILKKTALDNMSSNEDQPVKKKVYFEDGIFPNRESDDEDRKIIDFKLRRKLRRLHKLHGISINSINLDKGHKHEDDNIVDKALENAAPPPPPPGTPASHLEQPIYLRPPSPTPLFYFHFDSVVHSMYVSQLERAIPPRLLNPKVVPPAAVPTAQSPSNTQSPNSAATSVISGVGAATTGATNLQSSKKELATLAALNRSNRSGNNDHSSPKTLPTTATVQRQSDQPIVKSQSIEGAQSEIHQSPIKSSFNAVTGNVSTALPPSHMSPPTTSMQPQRQYTPIGFMGMRINNFARLPLSPLARHSGSPLPPNNSAPMAVVGVRHSFNMPPPTMMPPQHFSPSAEFSSQQQQHYHPMSHPNSQHMHHLNQPYPVIQPPLPHGNQHPHFPPTGTQIPPHHMYQHHHHRQQSAQFYMQSLPPPPPLPPPSRHTYVPPPETAPPPGESTSQLPKSPQAMVSPYNIHRQ